MTSRSCAALVLLALAWSVLLSSCDRADNAPPAQVQVASAPQSSATLSDDELVLLDRVTTVETLVPDASQRDLYEEKEAVTENGQRSYTIALKSQPGMDPSRHFQIITVTWGRAGTLVNPGATGPGVSGTGGPNGGFVDKISHTSDRTYDVRVSLGELLPNTAKTAAVDLDTLTQRLLDEYSKTKSRQP